MQYASLQDPEQTMVVRFGMSQRAVDWRRTVRQMLSAALTAVGGLEGDVVPRSWMAAQPPRKEGKGRQPVSQIGPAAVGVRERIRVGSRLG